MTTRRWCSARARFGGSVLTSILSTVDAFTAMLPLEWLTWTGGGRRDSYDLTRLPQPGRSLSCRTAAGQQMSSQTMCLSARNETERCRGSSLNMSSNGSVVKTTREVGFLRRSIILFSRRFLVQLFKMGFYVSNGRMGGTLTAVLTLAVLAICILGNPAPAPTPTPTPHPLPF
jgi:hypothetical protein